MQRLTKFLSLSLVTASLCSGCCSGNTPCSNGRIGPSNGEVIGAIVGVVAVVGVGTAIIITVEHKHHNITGCVLNGPGGLTIQDAGSKKTFLLAGATPNLKIGDLVRVHGSHVKAHKGGTPGQTFTVTDVKKDYGTCPAAAPVVASATTP